MPPNDPAPANTASPAAAPANPNPQSNTAPQGAPGAPTGQEPSPSPNSQPSPADKPPATPLSGDDPNKPAAPDKPGDFPDDWREKMANGDDKKLAKLKRYASPQAFLDGYLHAQTRISKGEAKMVLGDNPSPEDVKAYREANGIPEKPDGYKIELEQGLVVGEADKPWVNKALERMHAQNFTPEQVNTALNSYFAVQEEQVALRQETDMTQRQEVEETLRQEYGSEYLPNINAVKGLMNLWGEDIGSMLLRARDSETGDLIFNNKAFIRAMVQNARELNPAGSVVPNAGANAKQVVNDEIAALEKKMGTDEWFKDAKSQQRYQELVTARDKMNAQMPREQG